MPAIFSPQASRSLQFPAIPHKPSYESSRQFHPGYRSQPISLSILHDNRSDIGTLVQNHAAINQSLQKTVSKSLVSFLSESERDVYGDSYNTLPKSLSIQQINKKVHEWFDQWQPWQQKHLLLEITRRCSTNQLEALATTLEPVFHRDFKNFHYKKYPMPQSRTSSSLSKHSKSHRLSKARLSVSKAPPMTPGSGRPLMYSRDSKLGHSNPSLTSIQETTSVQDTKNLESKGYEDVKEKQEQHFESSIASIQETNENAHVKEKGESIGHLEGNDVHENFGQQISGFADMMSSDILYDVLREFQPPVETMEDFAERLVKDVMRNALRVIRTKENDKNAGIMIKVDRTSLIPVDKAADIVSSEDKPISRNGGTSTRRSLTPRSSFLLPRGRSRASLSSKLSKSTSSIEQRNWTKSYPLLYPDKSLPLSEVISLKDVIERELRNSTAFAVPYHPDPIDLVLADKSYDRRTASTHHNSFSKYSSPSAKTQTGSPNKVVSRIQGSPANGERYSAVPVGKTTLKLGPTLAGLRTGQVNKPSNVKDLNVHQQRRLRQKASVGRQKQYNLRENFEFQMEQIWEWLSEWEDFEKLGLLSEIMKISNTELLDYMTQCLHDRLKERLTIGWLPDRLLLLIFSYLDWRDIDVCSKVCRRWKHICAMDELWMIKCMDFGQHEGIPDIVQRIKDANQDNLGIDWRLAFLEVQRITRDAKSALAKPNPILVPDTPECVSEDNQTAPEAIETNSVITEATELPLKRGTAAQLARESNRLKNGGDYDECDDEEDWWSQRAAKTEGVSPLKSTAISPPSQSPRSTVGSLPRIAQREQKLRNGINSVRDLTGSVGTGSQLSIASSHTTPQPPATAMKPSAPQLGLSLGNLTTTTSEGGGGKYERLETQAVTQWIKGGRRNKDDGEIALDVRPDLVQAEDLLGKLQPTHALQWKEGDSKFVRKFAGKVPGVVKVRKFMGHMDAVLCVDFDKRRLISGSMDRSVRVWDVRSGRGIHKMYGHKGGVTCLKFDSGTLYTGSWDSLVMAWNLVTFVRKSVMTGHTSTVSCLAFDDKHLLSASHDATVRVWYRPSHTFCKVLHIHTSHIMSMQYDGTNVVTASSDRSVCITNIHTEQVTRVITAHPEPIHKIILVHRLVVTATLSGRVYFHNRDTGEPEAAMQAHGVDKSINALAFHRGRLYTASIDQTVKEWDLASLTCVRCLQGHKAPLNDFKISDKRMVSCSSDGQIRIWDIDLPDYKMAEVSDDLIPYEIVNQRDLE